MSLEIKVYALVFYLMNDIFGRDIVIAEDKLTLFSLPVFIRMLFSEQGPGKGGYISKY